MTRHGTLTPKFWARFFEGVLFKDELEVYAGGGGVDHGNLSGLTDDDHAQYLLKNGTRALTANWDAGSFEIRAQTLESDVATGTAPLTIASTTLVTNLNADLLDSQTGSYYLDSDNFTGTEWTDLTDAGATTLHKHDHGGQDGLADDDHTQYLLVDGSRNLGGAWQIDFPVSVVVEDGFSATHDLVTVSNLGATPILNLSDSTAATVIKGLGTRPSYNTLGIELALYSDTLFKPVTTQTTATLTLGASHYTVLCDATSNTVTINLPTAVGYDGRIYNIKAINVDNAVTVDANGTEEIDGSATAITLALMESITIQSDGSNWWII